MSLGPCRLACFLGGPVNVGSGVSVDHASFNASMSSSQRHAQDDAAAADAARPFYEQLGAIAALSGVCIDLFAASRQHIGLSALLPLCNHSGGACFHYTAVEGSALPQVLLPIRTQCRKVVTRPSTPGYAVVMAEHDVKCALQLDSKQGTHSFKSLKIKMPMPFCRTWSNVHARPWHCAAC